MDRVQLAAYGLLASAAVLLGLVLFAAQDRLPAAQAALIVNRDSYTFMTAQTRQGDESLFVADNINEKLLIYNVDLRGTRGRLELVKVEDLAQIFGALNPPTGGGAGGGAPTPGGAGGGRPRP